VVSGATANHKPSVSSLTIPVGVSNLAVSCVVARYRWTLTNLADDQVFYCLWTNGVWSAASAIHHECTGEPQRAGGRFAQRRQFDCGGFESGNFSAQPWTFTGNAPWTVQAGQSHSGSYAAASGTLLTADQRDGVE